MAGRKPLPTAVKELRGNPGHRALPAGEPQPLIDGSNAPRWLDPLAKGEWRRVVGELRRMRLLAIVDRAALEAYCQAYARWRRAERCIEREGLTYVTPTGYIRERPEVGIAERWLRVMQSYMSEFGMTPSSRSKVSTIPTPKETDPFEEFLRTEQRVTERNDE